MCVCERGVDLSLPLSRVRAVFTLLASLCEIFARLWLLLRSDRACTERRDAPV